MIGQLHALVCAAQRQLLAAMAEYDRREAWRDDGATSMAAWLAYRLGVSHRSGAEWARVGAALHNPRLPDEAGATVVAALEHLADAAKPDPETGIFEPYEARAADGLVELASSHLGAHASPDCATVVLHADASALVGGQGVAEVEGGSTVSVETLRRHACDARVEWVAHSGDGRAVGVGRARRTPPSWLSRQLRRRDGGCRYPGCERRRWGHAHHRLHWADGGATDLDNLVWLCPAHQRLVHEGGWRIEGDPEGRLVFVRPDGRPLATGPPPLRPDRRKRLLG